jgi:ABC-2 type transport system ATP-binding protein
MHTIIELDKVSVNYTLASERIHSFKEYMISKLKRKVHYESFHALKNVSLEIKQGEIFGLVGHNGAGKSTLLKVVARVLRPTTGRVRLHGRVFPLLELGAGFDMELTGRENIFLNSAILGFKKSDIHTRLDRIVAFAELEEFIDTPVRNYSTGMISRLGFAIATDIQPEVLIIDEVLSVGDAGFQKRSSERIQKFCTAGTTVLLVSHDLTAIQKMCHRAAWLQQGEVKVIDQTPLVIKHYLFSQESQEKNKVPD